MKRIFLNCFTIAVLTIFFIPNVYGQSEGGGLFSKLMMMMMKNRRRTYVPFAIPFNPLSYSSIIPINYPAVPIGGYPNYRSSLISSLNNGGHLGPLSPLGGIGPFSLGGLGGIPFLSSLRNDHKFLSRSSPIYEPTVAGSSLMPQIAVVAPAAPAQAASTNSFLITNPTALNNLLPPSTFANPHHLPASNQSPTINPLLATGSPTISNANSLSLTNAPLTNPTLSNSHLYSSAIHTPLLTATTNQNLMNNSNSSTSSTSSYSNAASNGNNLTDRTMNQSQGELIKQELKEHHLNSLRIQYLKSLRDHLIKDQQQKEQYLKELTKKSTVYPSIFTDMYEEINKKK